MVGGRGQLWSIHSPAHPLQGVPPGSGDRQRSLPCSWPRVPFMLTPAWWPCHLLDEAQLLSLELQDGAYATLAARSAITPAHPAHAACGVLAMCLLRDRPFPVVRDPRDQTASRPGTLRVGHRTLARGQFRGEFCDGVGRGAQGRQYPRLSSSALCVPPMSLGTGHSQLFSHLLVLVTLPVAPYAVSTFLHAKHEAWGTLRFIHCALT